MVKKPKKTKIPSTEELFKARVHLGHQTRRWSPKMATFIHTTIKKTHLLDLEKTQDGLKKAVDFLQNLTKQEKVVFVGTKRQVKDLIVKYAKDSDSFYVSERWVGGILTNFDHIKNNLDSLKGKEENLKKGKYDYYTKKERLLVKRRIKRDKHLFGGLLGIEKLPSALIIIDPKKEQVALKEAERMNIPIVALVDTNTNPEGVDYIIPGNDDAISSLELILETLSRAVR